MTKKNETATIRENENGAVHTVTKDHRDYMLTNHVTKNSQLKWVWIAEDGSEWTKMCGEWRRVTDRTHWYTGTVIGKEAGNGWSDRAETVEPEAPKTVRNEALGETTVARPVEGMTLDWWEGGETHTAPAWRGDNCRYFVMVDGTLYGVRDAFVAGTLRPVLGGEWHEVLGSEEDAGPSVSEEQVRGTVENFAEMFPGYVDRDLDAINEGWDAFQYPEDGYLYGAVRDHLQYMLGRELGDEEAEWLADATYSALCPEDPDSDGPEFAELTPEQQEGLETLNVGRAVITDEQAGRVRDALRLDGMGTEALTRVRNAAVRHLAGLMSAAREAGDWEWFDQLQANMSGVCAVIDCRLARMA